jgi:tetratricopeptide (TPR) repeat protein
MNRPVIVSLLAVAVLSAGFVCKAEEKPGDAYFKGVELASQGNLADAKAEYEKSLADYSVYPYAKLELRAIDEVEKGKIKKETALLVFQGKQLATQKKWDEAIVLYNKAVKENPNYAYAFVSRGIAYMSQGNLDKAISNYSEAISVYPQFTEAYQNRGVLYEYRGQFNKAIVDFDTAISAEPLSPVLYFNRGMAFIYKSQYDKALPDLNKVIEIKPDFAKAYINKGLVCEELGMQQEAVEAYKKAVQYDNSESKEITKDAQDSIKTIENDSKKDK